MNATPPDVSASSGALTKYFASYFASSPSPPYGCCVSSNNSSASEKSPSEALVYASTSKCSRKTYFGFSERMRFAASASDVPDAFSASLHRRMKAHQLALRSSFIELP